MEETQMQYKEALALVKAYEKQETLKKLDEDKKDTGLGMCVRCKHKGARVDYNGHGHWVCKSCDDYLSDEFDEEYR